MKRSITGCLANKPGSGNSSALPRGARQVTPFRKDLTDDAPRGRRPRIATGNQEQIRPVQLSANDHWKRPRCPLAWRGLFRFPRDASIVGWMIDSSETRSLSFRPRYNNQQKRDASHSKGDRSCRPESYNSRRHDQRDWKARNANHEDGHLDVIRRFVSRPVIHGRIVPCCEKGGKSDASKSKNNRRCRVPE